MSDRIEHSVVKRSNMELENEKILYTKEFITLPAQTDGGIIDFIHEFGVTNFAVIVIIGAITIGSLSLCTITLVALGIWSNKRRKKY